MAFYRPADPDICQGDIIDDVPHLHLRHPLEVVRGPMVAKGKQRIWGLYPYPPQQGDPVNPPQHLGRTVISAISTCQQPKAVCRKAMLTSGESVASSRDSSQPALG